MTIGTENMSDVDRPMPCATESQRAGCSSGARAVETSTSSRCERDAPQAALHTGLPPRFLGGLSPLRLQSASLQQTGPVMN